MSKKTESPHEDISDRLSEIERRLDLWIEAIKRVIEDTYPYTRGENRMKFKLTTSGFFYTDGQAAKLATLGFAFKGLDPARHRTEIACGYRKRRDIDIVPSITMNTMEELMAFARKWGRIVVSGKDALGPDTIEIYDDDRE